MNFWKRGGSYPIQKKMLQNYRNTQQQTRWQYETFVKAPSPPSPPSPPHSCLSLTYTPKIADLEIWLKLLMKICQKCDLVDCDLSSSPAAFTFLMLNNSRGTVPSYSNLIEQLLLTYLPVIIIVDHNLYHLDKRGELWCCCSVLRWKNRNILQRMQMSWSQDGKLWVKEFLLEILQKRLSFQNVNVKITPWAKAT